MILLLSQTSVKVMFNIKFKINIIWDYPLQAPDRTKWLLIVLGCFPCDLLYLETIKKRSGIGCNCSQVVVLSHRSQGTYWFTEEFPENDYRGMYSVGSRTKKKSHINPCPGLLHCGDKSSKAHLYIFISIFSTVHYPLPDNPEIVCKALFTAWMLW